MAWARQRTTNSSRPPSSLSSLDSRSTSPPLASYHLSSSVSFSIYTGYMPPCTAISNETSLKFVRLMPSSLFCVHFRPKLNVPEAQCPLCHFPPDPTLSQEYYPQPVSLPTVEMSSLKMDLYRYSPRLFFLACL